LQEKENNFQKNQNAMKKTIFLWVVIAFSSLHTVVGQDYEQNKRLEYKTRAIGNSWIGSVGKHMQNHITNITVFDDGTVRTQSPWDEGGNRCAEYKDGKFVRKANCDANSKRAVDKNGNTWTIENYYGRFLDINANHGGNNATDRWRIDPIPTGASAPYIRSSDGREIRLIADPSAIGINKKTGELLVADNTEAQNIKIFNISAEPQLVGTFGVEGGVYAGDNPGAKDDPLKFNGITGVGTDAAGNIYVACDGFPGSQAEGGGADLRAFNPDGTLRWRMVGLMFVRAASVDPASGGSDIYCPFTLYRVDYTKEPGNDMADWTDVALTINPFKYPDDPRLVGAANTALAIVNVNGEKFMFSTDMYNEPLFVHRFEGHIAVPVAVITAGYGWNGDEVIKFRWKHNRGRPTTPRWMWVDQNGDGLAQAEEFELFELGGPAERNFVRAIDIDPKGNIHMTNDFGYWILPTNGFDENKIPRYAAENIRFMEGPGFNPRAMKFLDDPDILIAGQGEHSHMSMVHVFDNWSDPAKRTKRFTIDIPNPSAGFNPVGGAFNIAADEGYIYVAFSVRAGPNTGKEGEVLVYSLADGAYMGYITPGPEVGNYSGWIDMRQATYAYARPNGERLITVEEDGVGKVLIYEWCPPGMECETECTQQVDSVSIAPDEIILEGFQSASLTATVYPENICFDKVYWESSDESVVTVNADGFVVATGVGNATIKAISEQQYDTFGSVEVTVNFVAVTGITIEMDSTIVAIGSSKTLHVDFVPENAINRKLLWESSDQSIFSVDSTGKFTGVSEGNAWLIATSDDGGFIDSTYVTVIAVPTEDINFRVKHVGVWVGETITPIVDFTPENADDQRLTWKIMDETLASVDENGKVTGLVAGNTNIVATTFDGAFADTVQLQVRNQGEFANLDIGNVCSSGSFSSNANGYNVIGFGVDIWHSSDEFHYAYQKHSGDALIIAHVKTQNATDGWAKTGVMIRETLEAGSKHVNMVITPSNGASFQWRKETAGSSDHTTQAGTTAPAWVKLIREGNTFRGYQSLDGKTWTLVSSQTIEMAAEVHVGLSVTAHSGACISNNSTYGYTLISDDINATPDLGSSDATLSDLTVDGVTVNGFSPEVLNYTMIYPDTDEMPVVNATTAHNKATKAITQTTKLPGDATVVVTAEDGVSKATYKINFDVNTAVGELSKILTTIYPNPAGDNINLVLHSNTGKQLDIRIYDVAGSLHISRQVTVSTGANEIPLDTSILSNGVYFLEVGGDIKTRIKFVIQK
jgi:uncharacterized protein YjdB/regulation of enolase protein 1 (concanavalin A-like superfamily)